MVSEIEKRAFIIVKGITSRRKKILLLELGHALNDESVLAQITVCIYPDEKKRPFETSR